MKIKYLILCSIAVCGISSTDAYSEEKQESQERKEKQHLLIPETCFEHSQEVLLENNLIENSDYTFIRTIYSGEAFKDIYGVLELSNTKNLDESKFMLVYKQVLDSCFANTSVGFLRTNSGSEWSDLSDFITELDNLDVTIHEIKINDEIIRVFIDKDDLDQKRKEKISKWLNKDDEKH